MAAWLDTGNQRQSGFISTFACNAEGDPGFPNLAKSDMR